MLKAFAELGDVYRNAPCQEYPGTWMLCPPQHLEAMGYGSSSTYSSDAEAIAAGNALLDKLEAAKVEYDTTDLSVCWKASDNDPRVGEVWFTGFYKLGSWSHFGYFKVS